VAARAHEVLRQHCAGCHGPGRGKGGFDYVLDRDRLVARGQVVPGSPDGSPLVQRVRQGEMPPPRRPRLPPDALAVLERWVREGAVASSAGRPAAPVTEADVARVVRTDLDNLPPRARHFARYLTLGHLAADGQDVLTTHRQAITKLVNSLSWHPRLTPPVAVDAASTVYRIDLRDHRWPALAWDRLAEAYPYRPAGEAPAAQPYVRGDWFVSAASRPPFYHDLLGLPETERALERLLQVDVAADLRDDAALRAGFNGSGVARNNRVLQRHDAAHGAYWRSYDFADSTGVQNVFEHPLGPAPGTGGFHHDGGEVIFHLPNGLLGFLLVDGQGRRIDKAPAEVVSDPQRPDRRVENGLSCFSCHAPGLLPKDDQVRPHVRRNPGAFGPDDRDAILALYAPPARMRVRLQEDNERYARALGRLGLAPGEPEPVGAVVRRYEGVLDLRAAAAEAGMSESDFASRLGRSPALRRTLGALLARGGTVQRAVFEQSFAELARELRLAREPVAVANAFEGHRAPVRDIAFAPDGRAAASASEDRAVLVWDVATGRLVRRLEGHTDEVTAVAFSPDGKRLLSGGRDRTVRLWDAESGRAVCCLRGHTDSVRAVALTTDGKRAVSGGEDRTVRVWDLEAGRERSCLAGHAGAVLCLALDPQGRLLSGSEDRTLRLWDLAAGRPLAQWANPGGAVHAVAFSPDGRLALSGGGDGVVRLWEVGTGREVQRFAGHAGAVLRVAFVPGGREALTGGSRYGSPDRVVRRWDVASGHELPAVPAGEGRVECLALRPDGRAALVAGGADMRLLELPARP
jgi:WD40 repeat protein